MNYKIEKDVPMPTPSVMYPFADMEVGDSFLANLAERPKISTYMNRHKKTTGKKFKTRKISDSECRVWRVE